MIDVDPKTKTLISSLRKSLDEGNKSIVFPVGFEDEIRRNAYSAIHEAFSVLFYGGEIELAGRLQANPRMNIWKKSTV